VAHNNVAPRSWFPSLLPAALHGLNGAACLSCWGVCSFRLTEYLFCFLFRRDAQTAPPARGRLADSPSADPFSSPHSVNLAGWAVVPVGRGSSNFLLRLRTYKLSFVSGWSPSLLAPKNKPIHGHATLETKIPWFIFPVPAPLGYLEKCSHPPPSLQALFCLASSLALPPGPFFG